MQTDAQILEHARNRGGTVFHPTSTCKMGIDTMAVVDPELRVHGIGGLRVVDASVMPTVVSGNTNAATIMIGEKAADLVRAADADGGLRVFSIAAVPGIDVLLIGTFDLYRGDGHYRPGGTFRRWSMPMRASALRARSMARFSAWAGSTTRRA